MRRFVALFRANIDSILKLEDDDIISSVKFEPVYDSNPKSVFVSGNISEDVDPDKALEVIAGYVRKHVGFVSPVKLEFREPLIETKRDRWAS